MRRLALAVDASPAPDAGPAVHHDADLRIRTRQDCLDLSRRNERRRNAGFTQLARDFDDLMPGVVPGKFHAIHAQGFWQTIEPLAESGLDRVAASGRRMFVGKRFLRMNSHSFDHVDLRVSSFAGARKFYDVFLPALGFPAIRAAESEVCYHGEGDRKMVPFIALNEEPDHRGNANRIAFRADSEEEVDRLGAIIRQAGGHQVEGPEYCRDYTPGYYAVFFEDADGNKWEICCRNARVR